MPLKTFAVALLLAISLPAQAPKTIPHDGNQGIFVHRIPLLHAEGGQIAPGDDPLLPFSTKRTCGECHDYKKISQGLHFNWLTARKGSGGEPWILSDQRTGTRLPLSWRDGPGTWHPLEAGIDQWMFTRLFGGWTPGGGAGEPTTSQPQPNPRFMVAGKLEINCLLCHGADPAQDASAWGVQVGRQNLLWAATAASGFARVDGSTASVSNTFDPFMEFNDETRGPTVRYTPGRFADKGLVFIDIKRRAGKERCLQCHSRRLGGLEKWQTDQDVHLAAGLVCQDCHRNGMNHQITRGVDDPFSCRSCHLESGRLGAPRPRHAGLPTLHLDRLTCTACHSGPQPQTTTRLVQTSRSHRMGVKGTYRGKDSAPAILSPVYRPEPTGALAPHRILYPAFFGYRQGAKVNPVPFFALRSRALELWGKETPNSQPAKAEVRALLANLAGDGKGEPVYISGGMVHQLGKSGKLESTPDPAADPCAWKFAHPVRPAAAATGVDSCLACHQAGAPFFFGRVAAPGAADVDGLGEQPMHHFQQLDATGISNLALSFSGRWLFKIVGFAATGFCLAALFLFSLSGLKRILKLETNPGTRMPPPEGRWSLLIGTALGLSFFILLGTGLWAFSFTATRITGCNLLLHCAAGSVFAPCLALELLAWGHCWRFHPEDGPRITLVKCCCWIAALAGTGSLLTSLLPMLPLFGSEGLDLLQEIHCWCALFAIFAVFLLAYRLWFTDNRKGNKSS